MLAQTKKILRISKKEVFYKIITSLFIQGLTLIIPVFWSLTINKVTDSNIHDGYILVIITGALSILYYVWAYLNQKTWYTFYNKLYLEYTKLTVSEATNIDNINLGEYTNILNNDIDIICNFLGNLITRIFQILAFIIIYMYFLSLNFTIFIITVIVSVILLFIYIKEGKEVQRLNIKRKTNLDRKTIMLHKMYSSITNKKENILSITNLFNKANKSYLRANYNYNVVIQKIIYSVLSAIDFTRYGIVLFAVYLLSIGNIEIGTILLVYSYYDKIITNFEMLGTITADYQSFTVSLQRLNRVISGENVVKEN